MCSSRRQILARTRRAWPSAGSRASCAGRRPARRPAQPRPVSPDGRWAGTGAAPLSRAAATSSTGAAARVLILTTFDLDEYTYEALRAGASGFVIKDDPPEQLIAAIRTVAAGDALLSPAVTMRVIKQFARVPRLSPPREFDEFTTREQEVLRPIACGLSNAETGHKLYIGGTTVKTHITHILQKLNLRDRAQLIVLAYQTGMFC
ncbi:MAG: response regulator transcription factor [Dactylosporangium sp.]|nr:response regulator transcription factor [Dactylosporangium sp.]NNJ62002.1 response regulator transcription factor [Dactylosporangium sp.]